MSTPAFDDARRLTRRVRVIRRVFDLPMAQQTLPLLSRVARDIVAIHAQVAHLTLRRDKLAKETGSGAAELFRLNDEIDAVNRQLQQLRDELFALGVLLLDPVHGVVGFPTIVNGSLAYLIYRTEDDAIRHWRYRDQSLLRPIPASWSQTAVAGQSEAEDPESLLV